MIAFFPTPYPDELFYSLIARYHLRSGNRSYKATLQELFGDTHRIASIPLPAGIDALVEHLPMLSPITASDFIEHHTLYRFYTAFLPWDRAQAIEEAMHSQNGKSIYMKAGLMASSMKANRFLRFCPVCAQEDREQFGEIYWHRQHQIPTLPFCLKHHVLLQDSAVLLQSRNRHAFQHANEKQCDLKQPIKPIPLDAIGRGTFPQRALQLLNKRLPHREGMWFSQRYRQILIKQGYASIRGEIDQKKLQRDFEAYYGNDFLALLQSSLHGEQNWLMAITRKHRKAFHPIHHLLLIDFLDLSLEQLFFAQDEEVGVRPFGEGPWPCLNPAADHFHRDVVRELHLTTCEKTKLPIGTFRCQCGFIYSRKGPDKQPEDRYRRTRVKAFGPVWEEKLQELWQQGHSLRAIARKLHVDPKTVRRYEQRSHREKPNSLSSMLSAGGDDIRATYQRRWLRLQNKHPEKTKTELRSLAPKVYIWLYRHDPIWLQDHSPPQAPRTTKKQRVDWERRDAELSARVEVAIHQLLRQEGDETSITIRRIGTLVGQRALLEKQLNRLPKTKALLWRWKKGNATHLSD